MIDAWQKVRGEVSLIITRSLTDLPARGNIQSIRINDPLRSIGRLRPAASTPAPLLRLTSAPTNTIKKRSRRLGNAHPSIQPQTPYEF